MSVERILVTTQYGSTSRSFVWDPSAPMGIGHPFRWALEKTDSGVRLRDLTGKPGELSRGSSFSVDEQQLSSGAVISLAQASIRLRRVDPVTPPYASRSSGASSEAMPLLYAFSGSRRSLTSCQQIHSAYVAHVHGNPAFTVHRASDGIRVKVLSSGVRLRFRGQAPVEGRPGETWSIKREELAVATVFRRWQWWRFNFAAVPAELAHETHGSPEEGSFARVAVLVALVVAALIGGTLLMPKPEKPPELQLEKKPEPPLVKVIARKPPTPPAKPVGPGKNEELGRAGAPPPAAGPKSPAPKPPQPKAPKPAPPKAAPPKQVQPPKPTALPPPTAVARPAPKPVVIPVPVPEPPKPPEKTPAEIAAEIAQERTRMLKESLMGATALTKKAPLTPSQPISKNTEMFSGARSDGGAPTEIKPSFSGGSAKVSGIGGGGLGGRNGTSGAGVGYGSAGSLTGAGAGGSLVSMDTSGGTVNEGLSMDEVGAVIQRHMGEVRYCHEASLVRNPRVAGKLIIDFEISPSGSVSRAKVDSSTLGTPTLDECIRSRLVTWKFPRPRGGVYVPVTFPFIFKVLEKD